MVNGGVMKRLICITILLGTIVSVTTAPRVFAQEPATAQARQAPQPIPLFFKETWKNIPGNVPLTQDFVVNPNLQVQMYGTGKEDFNITAEGNVPHIWTGLCASSCALTLKHKESYADLTGKAKIKWFTKTSGFHEIRPVVKLSDGTWLIGDHVDAYVYDYHESEFFLAEVRWLKLDMTANKVNTKGTLLDKVDLSKIDEIGFADLTPGSGHGLGGFSDVAWIEVYGKPVNRAAAAK